MQHTHARLVGGVPTRVSLKGIAEQTWRPDRKHFCFQEQLSPWLLFHECHEALVRKEFGRNRESNGEVKDFPMDHSGRDETPE